MTLNDDFLVADLRSSVERLEKMGLVAAASHTARALLLLELHLKATSESEASL